MVKAKEVSTPVLSLKEIVQVITSPLLSHGTRSEPVRDTHVLAQCFGTWWRGVGWGDRDGALSTAAVGVVHLPAPRERCLQVTSFPTCTPERLQKLLSEWHGTRKASFGNNGPSSGQAG